MQKCWSQEIEERPVFQSILKQLNSLSPQEGDLMDNLVSMLEKYSTNLEGIVAERTAELNIEKQKTEDLVCREYSTLKNTCTLYYTVHVHVHVHRSCTLI